MDLPIAVTFCPLCNASIVFDRRLDGRVLDFGTTGKLRKSDLVMYDRQTESWWQQFTGKAIVGRGIINLLSIILLRSLFGHTSPLAIGTSFLPPNLGFKTRYVVVLSRR